VAYLSFVTRTFNSNSYSYYHYQFHRYHEPSTIWKRPRKRVRRPAIGWRDCALSSGALLSTPPAVVVPLPLRAPPHAHAFSVIPKPRYVVLSLSFVRSFLAERDIERARRTGKAVTIMLYRCALTVWLSLVLGLVYGQNVRVTLVEIVVQTVSIALKKRVNTTPFSESNTQWSLPSVFRCARITRVFHTLPI